jgi:hypothetical protein
MIYLTTFILTLFLTQIARALPQGFDDPIFPESSSSTPDLYGDSLYDFTIPLPLRITYDYRFDNPYGLLDSAACANGPHGLAARYPRFGDLPTFPYIGGAFGTPWNSPDCGECWRVTNKANHKSIYVTAIDYDYAGQGFNIAAAAFWDLNDGYMEVDVLEVTAQKVPPSFCGL